MIARHRQVAAGIPSAPLVRPTRIGAAAPWEWGLTRALMPSLSRIATVRTGRDRSPPVGDRKSCSAATPARLTLKSAAAPVCGAIGFGHRCRRLRSVRNSAANSCASSPPGLVLLEQSEAASTPSSRSYWIAGDRNRACTAIRLLIPLLGRCADNRASNNPALSTTLMRCFHAAALQTRASGGGQHSAGLCNNSLGTTARSWRPPWPATRTLQS